MDPFEWCLPGIRMDHWLKGVHVKMWWEARVRRCVV